MRGRRDESGRARRGRLLPGVCSRTPRSFSDADESVLVRLADRAAAAIHNNRLFAAEQAARTEAQRSAQDFGDLVDTLDAIVLDADASKVKGWASRPTRRPAPQTTPGETGRDAAETLTGHSGDQAALAVLAGLTGLSPSYLERRIYTRRKPRTS